MGMELADTDEMKKYAAQFALQIVPHRAAATVLTLSGDLGAGKTTFAQAFAKALGVEEDVTSPTFVIEKIYLLKGQKFSRLIHIDAYRLENPQELEGLGFAELLRDPANVVLIEWPEKVAGLIPATAMRIRFDIAGERRTISINGQG